MRPRPNRVRPRNMLDADRRPSMRCDVRALHEGVTYARDTHGVSRLVSACRSADGVPYTQIVYIP